MKVCTAYYQNAQSNAYRYCAGGQSTGQIPTGGRLPFLFLAKLCIALLGSHFLCSASAAEWSVSGSWNLRYEQLTNPLFPTTDERFHQHNQRLSSKLRVKAGITWADLALIAEVSDSRVYLDNDDPTLTQAQVNTLEPAQFNVNWNARWRITPALVVNKLSVGRFILDYGSRRLIASGEFRNAMNTFDGMTVALTWSDWEIITVYLLPVNRLPSDAVGVDNNEQAFDKSDSERNLFGFYAVSPDATWHVQTYWLKESDSERLDTANRDLFTVSTLYRLPANNLWVVEAEVVLQAGTRRETTSPEDLRDLQHRALMAHVAVGPKLSASTTVQAIFELASGDNDKNDNVSHGFDSLYGVRRFDYGPTDVYRSMPRRNLIALGARLDSRLSEHQTLLLRYLAFWHQRSLEENENFIGHQLEFRWRYQLTKGLRWETGGAYMFKGEVLAQGDYSHDTIYGYSGFRISF